MSETRLTLQLPAQHPSYAGHFPGRPIVPGVLLLQAVVQAAQALRGGADGAVPDIPVCKFSASLPPGATVDLTLVAEAGGGLSFRVSQAGQPVASGRLRWPQPT